MSDARSAALLLAHACPKSQREREVFAAQHLACQLYAGNHDMVIVGLIDLAAGAVAAPVGALTLPGDKQLPVVGPSDVDVIIAVAPLSDDAASARFAAALEQLCAQQIDVVFVEGREL